MADSSKIIGKDKGLKILEESYLMYEKTKKETEKHLREKLNSDGTKMYSEEDIKKNLELIQNSENDIIEQYKELGGNPDNLGKKKSKKSTNSNMTTEQMLIEEAKKSTEKAEKETSQTIVQTVNEVKETLPSKGEYNPKAAFDVIKLPSKGEGYKSKRSTMPVAYLTAYDENMIVSPNLYRDNKIIDYLIQEKVQNNEIEPMDLLEGDRDAIVLFLRMNGYGNDYPITVTDDATGIKFDTIADLSQLNFKKFDLKGDDNGWFEYKLPVSGSIVKFRFPTHRDTVTLKKLEEIESKKLMKFKVSDIVDTLNNYIDNDDSLTAENKAKLRQSVNEVEKWKDGMSDDDDTFYSHALTNRLNLLIMSVDDVTDKVYINNFIHKMCVKDSSSLRRYISDNEPGIDYNITVNRPESLGGGSMKVFLQLDQYIFLNIPN